MIPILDNSERARRVVLFFWVLLGTHILSFGSNIIQFLVLTEIQSGSEVSEKTITANDLQYGLVGLTVFGANLAVIITFIQWFRRAYHNLQRAGYHTAHTEGWAAGSWFVPILNWFRPYHIMKEIWYETQASYAPRVKNHSLVKIWWILFLLYGWYGNITFRLSLKSETASDMLRDSQLSMAEAAFSIPCIIVSVIVVRKASFFESQHSQQLQIETVGVAQPIAEDDNAEEEFY